MTADPRRFGGHRPPLQFAQCPATRKNRVMTIFEKIIRREIPADVVWEDDEAIAFRDVNPQAPVHVLIVPKRVIPRLADANEEDEVLLGKLLLASRKVAEKLDLLESGYRVVINSGPDAGESVPHLHVHVLGKRALAWPPG
jgi:histidine triad (HIT) family protein